MTEELAVYEPRETDTVVEAHPWAFGRTIYLVEREVA